MKGRGLFTHPHKIFQSAGFVDFALQNQQNRHSEEIFFGGASRQKTFRTASK
jgi:hypothetical protein